VRRVRCAANRAFTSSFHAAESLAAESNCRLEVDVLNGISSFLLEASQSLPD
jgi:hypothetical protein